MALLQSRNSLLLMRGRARRLGSRDGGETGADQDRGYPSHRNFVSPLTHAVSFAPSGLYQLRAVSPGAYAPGCILAPLRGSARCLLRLLRTVTSSIPSPSPGPSFRAEPGPREKYPGRAGASPGRRLYLRLRVGGRPGSHREAGRKARIDRPFFKMAMLGCQIS